jgi:putative ABC transport system permease protein
MRWSELWSDVRYRWRALVDHRSLERELDDELRFHLEREAERLERNGLSRDDAVRRARLAFGGVERAKEASRDARGTTLVETTVQDLGYAIRGLRAKPGFTVGVVLTLGLGIGANAAMFGIVDRLLFRPPAFLRDPALVHRVYEVRQDEGDSFAPLSRFPRFLDVARWTSSFSTITAFSTNNVAVGEREESRELRVTSASANYWNLFDVRPVIGRFFTAADDIIPTGSPVVVLGYAYWQTQFGGRADVVGKTLRVGRTLCTIIGVAPESFVGFSEEGVPALFIPVTTHAWDLRGSDIRKGYDYTTVYTWTWFRTVVRRKPGVSVAAANADLTQAIQRSWRKQRDADPNRYAATDHRRLRGMLGPVQYERGPEGGPQAKVALWVSGVALIVLLIACANVANLLLARAVSRRREIALRLALGVSRGRLTRQLLTESIVLAVIGGAVGLAAAQWGGGLLRALFLPPDVAAPTLSDSRTLVVALVATLASAIATGLAPSVQALRYDLSHVLGAGGRDSGGRRSSLRTALLIFQATLCVVLLAGAGLFVRSLRNVRATHLGFDVNPILVVTDNMRGARIAAPERIALERQLVEDVRTMPGVVSATPSPSIPFWAYEGRPLFVPGIDSVDRLGDFMMQAGNADYFRTLGTRLLRGRAIDDHDGPTSPRVVVVSDGMATALWPGQDPIGKCIRISADTNPCTTVIGVAEDMRINHLRSRDRADHQFTYTVPITQFDAGPAGDLLVRVAGNAADFAEPIRRRLQRLMPGASYVTTSPLQRMVDPEMQSWRLGATMFVAFAALALVIAGVGLYSVIAYGVAQRRHEIGVRIALGASRARVVRLVVGNGLRVVVAGVVTGTLLALWAGRWIASLLFNESPSDPLVFVVVACLLLAVALVASAMPAFAAARVDPNIALRTD